MKQIVVLFSFLASMLLAFASISSEAKAQDYLSSMHENWLKDSADEPLSKIESPEA